MDRRLLKETAKKHLNSNLTISILAFFIVLLLMAFTMLFIAANKISIFIILFILFSPIIVGYARFNYNLAKSKEGNIADLFPFSDGRGFGRDLIGISLYSIFLIGWTILLIGPGIYKAFAYAMAPFIIQDPEFSHLNGIQVITRSRNIMNGHKLEYFDLLVSFIGWYLLVIVTLGLAAFYVVPYVQQTKTQFYLELKKENN